MPGSGSYLWLGMPMGLKVAPSAWVEYAQKRLEPWQVLYEPGHEVPLEGKFNRPLTADFKPTPSGLAERSNKNRSP